jgi:alpha-N-acetylglucosamine transferase
MERAMKAILTIAVGQAFHDIAALTHPAMAAYARRTNADFISLNTDAAEPHFQKARIAEFLKIYDRILYLDTDIVVNDGCPDLFAIVPEDRFGAWFPNPMFPGRFADRIRLVQQVLGDIGWVDNYFNSGVMLVSPAHAAAFDNLGEYRDDFFEQTLLNYRVRQDRYPTKDIGFRWNHTGAVVSPSRLQSHFIHYAGSAHMPGVDLIDQIRADLKALGRL